MAHRRTTDETLMVAGTNVVRELLASAQPVDRIWLRSGTGAELAEGAKQQLRQHRVAQAHETITPARPRVARAGLGWPVQGR